MSLASRHCPPMSVIPNGEATPLTRVELGRHEASGDRREAFVQDLVHKHPDLIPMMAIEPAFAPLIPICTELPTAAGFLDNLWMTTTGGIILGECKLVRNTQARREVLVQALDYARALQGWHFDELQDAVRKARKEPDLSLWQHVMDAGGGDGLTEPEFVDAVERRLRDGRFIALVILDGVQEGLEALTNYLQLHAGLHVSLAIIELSIWQGLSGELLVMPRVPLKTVLVERGIVTVDASGLPKVLPNTTPAQGKKTQNTLGKPFTASQADFFERLGMKVRGQEELLRAFLDEAEAIGITPEYGRSLILRLHASPDVPASAGYIDASGAAWLGDAVYTARKLGVEEAGQRYLDALATAIGGTVQTYPNTNSPPRLRNRQGQTANIRDLLAITAQWLQALQHLIEDVQSAANRRDLA